MACSSCGKRNRIPFSQLDKTARCGQCKAELHVNEPVAVRSAPDFAALIQGSSVPVLTDFWAAWCGPCKMLAPELNQVARRRARDMLVAKVDTEAVPQLAQHYGISSIPCLIVFVAGREAGRTAGARPAAAIEAFTDQAAAAVTGR